MINELREIATVTVEKDFYGNQDFDRLRMSVTGSPIWVA